MCPTCGRLHAAATLTDLVKQVKTCCTRRRAKQGRRPVFSHSLSPPVCPLLPVELRFARLVISQNKTTYAHWSRHHEDKADWMRLMKLHALHLMGLYLSWSHWSLVRRYARPNRELDFANLVGGAKPLIDSLVDCGVIEDDRPSAFLCDYRQEPGKISETVLTLLEARE